MSFSRPAALSRSPLIGFKYRAQHVVEHVAWRAFHVAERVKCACRGAAEGLGAWSQPGTRCRVFACTDLSSYLSRLVLYWKLKTDFCTPFGTLHRRTHFYARTSEQEHTVPYAHTISKSTRVAAGWSLAVVSLPPGGPAAPMAPPSERAPGRA